MKFYQEITLIPQADISPHAVWSKLYTQLHLAFVEQKDEQDKTIYGVSFPQYRTIADKKLPIWAVSCEYLHRLSRHYLPLIWINGLSIWRTISISAVFAPCQMISKDMQIIIVPFPK